jgi:flagellar hook-associated protein 3 FlgL
MRITRSMMVNNMMYWTEKQLEKLNDASNIVASGKQINKPSDDPSSASQILSDRANLSSYGQYQSNITQAETWIKTSSTTLETVDSYLDQAQEIMSSLATADTETVAGYLASLKNIYDQVLSLANSKYGSSYMYGGTKSDAAPFSLKVAGSYSGGVDYNGDLLKKQVLVGEGSSISINSVGSEIFTNVFSVLSQAINAIETSNLAVDLGGDFDDAFADIQAEEVSLSNINAQLEYKNDHLEKLMTNAYNRISDLEVGSTEEWAIKLQAQQTNYDVTLEAVANVLKMTKLTDLM